MSLCLSLVVVARFLRDETPELVERASKVGAIVVAKPFDLSELTAIVEGATRRISPAREIVRTARPSTRDEIPPVPQLPAPKFWHARCPLDGVYIVRT